MKHSILLSILLFFHLRVHSFQGEIFQIDSLPTKGILLNKGWKFQTGDNLAFAKPNFNDANWAKIDPTKDIMALPQVQNKQTNWLRLKFEVKSKLTNLLGIAINQAGASEIYLNGQLIHRIGHIDSDPKKIKAHDPLEYPVYFPADTIGTYVLAVRYSLQPNIRYTEIYRQTKNRLFNATVIHLVDTLNTKRSFNKFYRGLEIFVVGILFMLLILHTVFYVYLQKNKTHLLLALYMLGIILTRAFKFIGESQFSVEDRFYNLNFSNLLLSLSTICLARVYYRIAKMRLDIYYYIYVAFNVIYVPISFFSYGLNLQTIFLLFCSIIGFIISIRLTRIGLNKKIKGFIVLSIAIGIGVFGLITRSVANLFLNYGISPIGFNDLNYGISPYLVEFFINIGAVAIPISLSIFMGIEAGETNKNLINQLGENEKLKNLAIEKEQEKQQILEKQNETLEQQVEARTIELRNSQNQLIQQEKLASLGELMAGIAHEIQNPLNFVNNFSELSVDLIEEAPKPPPEAKEDWLPSEIPYGGWAEFWKDLKQNLDKINHHGKRASSIVKAMLEHTRTSNGIKQQTDLNALCDEYLRLSFHGNKAKENQRFNADFELIADPELGLVNCVPQDIGRVLLNLFNNAFYAVNEKTQKQDNSDYKPKVIVSTKLIGKMIEIKVIDNGNGMDEEVKNKIFQPFFTTKPTGEGTGLGLSLSYDIISKAHDGSLEVNTQKGKGTTFIIKIPKN